MKIILFFSIFLISFSFSSTEEEYNNCSCPAGYAYGASEFTWLSQTATNPNITITHAYTCGTYVRADTFYRDYVSGDIVFRKGQDSQTCTPIPDCVLPEVLDTATNTCSVPPVLPCDNPNLIRDSNGTCVCPDYSEELNEKYDTCLPGPDSGCPIQEPPNCVYLANTNTHLWVFYDCLGQKYKSVEGAGDCSVLPSDDLDGDGIPNASDPDMDGDGIDNDIDPDMDGDGIPNESDPDNNDGGTGSSPDTVDKCTAVDPHSHSAGSLCLCDTGYTKQDGVCNKDTLPAHDTKCDYPSVNSNYDFQGYTVSRDSCVYQYTHWSNNGKGITAKLETCEQYGCYYNTGQSIGDENVSDTATGSDSGSGLTDSNGTIGDSQEQDKNDAGAFGDFMTSSMSNIKVKDVLVLNGGNAPKPINVTLMGHTFKLFDPSVVSNDVWSTLQTVMKWVAIVSGIMTVFMTI